MEGNEKKQDVDKGYAWVILTGCFFMYLFVVGSLKSYGVLYNEMRDYFDSGSGNTAWLGSITFLFTLGLGPFANLLSSRTSFRLVAFTGGILLGVGYFVSALVPSIGYMFFTFGTIAGLGYGFAFSPCSTIISYYFEEHRALANGITVSASGIGALGFPFLYKFLLETFGFRGTMWIISAILLNVCAAACSFRQPDILVHAERKRRMETRDTIKISKDDKDGHLLNGDINKKTKASWMPNFKFALFKNPKFALYALSFTLCMNGYGNNLILIPSHIKSLGYSQAHVVIGVSVMGGCEVFSRILFGWLADKEIVTRRTLFLFSMTFSSIFVFIAPFFKQFEYFVAYAAIIGIFPGSFWSLISVLLIDAVGLEDFTSAFGLVSMCLAIGAFISQPVIGWMEDLTGNWHASFYLTGSLLLLSGLVVLFEPCVLRACLPKPEIPIDDVLYSEFQLRASLRKSPSPRTSQDDNDSLMDDDVDADVSFTSARISKIYRPVKQENDRSPSRHSAPLATASEI